MSVQGNLFKLYCFYALKMTLFPMAIITLFWKDQIGLSLTEILVLQAIFSGATVLLEYPSGYLSDRLGYRSALILASVLTLVGYLFYIIADDFTGVLLAELVLGCGWAFLSGSDNALLFETLRQLGRETEYARLDGRMNGLAQVGEAGGALFAGLMYAIDPLLPFYGQIGVWLIALILCIRLVEPEVEQVQRVRSHFGAAFHTIRYALSNNKSVRFTILMSTALGLVSFYPVWLIQPYMQQAEVPLAWFGPIWAGANLTVAFASMLSYKLRNAIGPRRMVVLFIVLAVIGYGGLWSTAGLWGFLFYYVLTAMRGLQGPIMRNNLQLASTRSNRASILSLNSFSFRMAFVMTGPLVGMCADRLGLHQTFGLLALFFLLILPPCARMFVCNLPELVESK